jgi:hypothetical protein
MKRMVQASLHAGKRGMCCGAAVAVEKYGTGEQPMQG